MYLKNLIVYIHQNPQKHGFVKDFKEYIHSSYNTFLSSKNTKIKRNDSILKYGNLTQFINTHHEEIPIDALKKIKIEVE